MPAYSADPDLLDSLATNLESQADTAGSNATAAASLCRTYGYSYSAGVVEGSLGSTSGWAADWVSSIRQRAGLLRAYDEISLLGAGAAGGAGPALGAGRIWALGETDASLSFEAWYRDKLATLEEIALAKQLATQLGDALADKDYAAVADLIGSLEDLSPGAAAAFFNELGPESLAKIPARLVAMHTDAPHLGVNNGMPQDLMMVVSQQLSEASNTGLLEFTGGELIEADLNNLEYDLLNGYDAAYLFMSDGFDAEFIASAAVAYLPIYQPDLAQPILGLTPTDPRTFLLDNAAEAGAGGLIIMAMVANGTTKFLLGPQHGFDEAAWDGLEDLVAQGTTGLLGDDGELASYNMAGLLDAKKNGDFPGWHDELAEFVVVLMPQLVDVTDGAGTDGTTTFTNPLNSETIEISKSGLADVLATLVASDPARATILEGVAGYFAAAGHDLGNAPEDEFAAYLNAYADDMGEFVGVLIVAINESDIGEARERDEARAALIGMLDTVVALIPGPGKALTKALVDGLTKDILKNVINSTYGEFVDRGFELLELSEESGARIEADAFLAEFKAQMAEALVLAAVQANPGIEVSVADFLATQFAADEGVVGPLLDQDGNFITADGYAEWFEWVSVSNPDLVDAISIYIDQVGNELPVWSS